MYFISMREHKSSVASFGLAKYFFSLETVEEALLRDRRSIEERDYTYREQSAYMNWKKCGVGVGTRAVGIYWRRKMKRY
jgi:hypothetical protein